MFNIDIGGRGSSTFGTPFRVCGMQGTIMQKTMHIPVSGDARKSCRVLIKPQEILCVAVHR